MTLRECLLLPLKLFYDRCFRPVYRTRVAKIVADLCPDGSCVLDYGCDDGCTAHWMMAFNPTLRIVGVDIRSNPCARIPMAVFDGNRIPYPDDTFDVVISLDVLHHTEDIPRHLGEMRRVSKRYIVIKDHMTRGFFSRRVIAFGDYISNVPYGIKCAFNFPSEREWHRMFEDQDMEIVDNPKGLDFGFGINERYNPVFKLQKRNQPHPGGGWNHSVAIPA